jgi:iron complex transport system substrate-binding protein
LSVWFFALVFSFKAMSEKSRLFRFYVFDVRAGKSRLFILQFKFILTFAVVVLSFALSLNTACRPSSANNQAVEIDAVRTREIVDDLGRKIKVSQKIERVVSLAPNLTENVFAIGAGEKLVGVTTYCNYPTEAAKIAKIGDTLKPNLEAIVAQKPQLVLVSTASQLEGFTRRMDEQNIPVFVTNPKNFDEVLENLEELGDLLGASEAAAKLVSDLKTRAGTVENRVKTLSPVRVFVQISPEPFTVGRDSFVTDLVRRAGGESVTKDVPEAYPRVSREMALASEPEAIILSVDNQMGEGNAQPAAVFRNSPAVRNNRVYRIDGDFLTRPGARNVDGIEALANALHP